MEVVLLIYCQSQDKFNIKLSHNLLTLINKGRGGEGADTKWTKFGVPHAEGWQNPIKKLHYGLTVYEKIEKKNVKIFA